jgi:hypothetical protein
MNKQKERVFPDLQDESVKILEVGGVAGGSVLDAHAVKWTQGGETYQRMRVRFEESRRNHIFDIDPSGTIAEVLECFYRIVGKEYPGALTEPTVLRGADAEQWRRDLLSTGERASRLGGSHSFTTADGRVHWVRCRDA